MKKRTSGNSHHNVTDRRSRRRTDVYLNLKLNQVFAIVTVMSEQQEGVDYSFTNSCRTGYLVAITALSQ